MDHRTKQRFDVSVAGSQTQFRVKKPAAKRKDETWYYFGLVGEIGFTIALPIAAGGILGAYVDQYFKTSPEATLTLLAIGIMISFIGFFHIVEEVCKKRTN